MRFIFDVFIIILILDIAVEMAIKAFKITEKGSMNNDRKTGRVLKKVE